MVAYSLKISKQVDKFLAGLAPDWRTRFRVKLESLRQDPYRHPQLDVKRVQGIEGAVYRLRVGPYRVIYEIRDNELLVYLMKAGSRGDVYK